MINDNIVITVVESRNGQCKIAIDADRDVKIYREEIYYQIKLANLVGKNTDVSSVDSVANILKEDQLKLNDQMKPTIDGCAMALGIHRDTLNNWEHGESGSYKLDVAKKCKYLVKTFMEAATMEGKLNPIVWMFYGKNYFGMVDKQEMVLTPNRSEGDTDVSAIQERLKAMKSSEGYAALPEGTGGNE